MDKNLIDEAFAGLEKHSPDISILKEEMLFFYAVYLKNSGNIEPLFACKRKNQYLLMDVCILSYLRNKHEDENLFSIYKRWHTMPIWTICHPIYTCPNNISTYRSYWDESAEKRFNSESAELDLSSYSFHDIALMVKESQVLAKYAEMVKESVNEILVGGFEIFYAPAGILKGDIRCYPENVCPDWKWYYYRKLTNG